MTNYMIMSLGLNWDVINSFVNYVSTILMTVNYLWKSSLSFKESKVFVFFGRSVFWALFAAIYLCFGMPEVYRVLFEVFGMDPEAEDCQPRLRRQLEDIDYVSVEFEGNKLSWQDVATYRVSFLFLLFFVYVVHPTIKSAPEIAPAILLGMSEHLIQPFCPYIPIQLWEYWIRDLDFKWLTSRFG